jgi:prepilin-type N-terminal cleavage/methylation domain-containing protein
MTSLSHRQPVFRSKPGVSSSRGRLRGPGRAFSLLELLTVIAVIGTLAIATAPAMRSMLSSQKLAQGAYDVASLLELARSEAVGRQTYVWVAFENVETPVGREVRAVAVASVDGSGTNTSEANVAPLSRVLKVQDAVLAPWEDLKTGTRALGDGVDPDSVSKNKSGMAFSVGATRFQSGSTLTITPRGEVLLKGSAGPHDGYNPQVAVSLRQARGSQVAAGADDAAVLVEGSTGSIRILRER